jgi:hypothetical protein
MAKNQTQKTRIKNEECFIKAMSAATAVIAVSGVELALGLSFLLPFAIAAYQGSDRLAHKMDNFLFGNDDMQAAGVAQHHES